jgi:signal transduction histidine kinase
VLLTYLAHQLAQQSRLQDSLNLQRQFSQQLAQYQDRTELAQFIVRFPSASMPVDQVVLFQYDHLAAQLEFVAAPADINYVRKLSKTPSLHEAATCPLISITTGPKAGKCFCLPLVHDSILVGVLRLRCCPEQPLSPAQAQFLNTVSPQMALALARSIAFPRQLTEAQLAERRRMAYELHDSLAQHIGFLHLSLDRLASDERLAQVGGLQDEIERLRDVADETYLQVRDRLYLLRKQGATDLVEMIQDYVRSIESQVPFKIELSMIGSPQPLGPITNQSVFSLIQESLNNVQKHAHAQVVQIKLAWHTAQLEVAVTDNGVGFEAASVPGNERLGLTMMRERVQELHGKMQLESAPGVGTTVKFEIPLPTS